MSTFWQNWDFDIGWQSSIFPWTKCVRNEEKWLYWSSSSNVSGCAKALCPPTSCTKVLSPTVYLIPRPSFTSLWRSNVEYLLPVIDQKVVFCLHHWNCRDFVNNSHSKCRCRLHKCRMSTHSDTRLSCFAIFSKTGFLDIVPLCRQPSL